MAVLCFEFWVNCKMLCISVSFAALAWKEQYMWLRYTDVVICASRLTHQSNQRLRTTHVN